MDNILPLSFLLKRLNSEEEELKKEKIKFIKVDYYNGDKPLRITLPTIYGVEEVPVIRRYIIKFKAKGYAFHEIGGNFIIRPQWNHVVSIYILRHYPLPNPRERLGAPIRILWESNIFHPNIAPGPLYGGTGIICWNIYKKWLKTITLLYLVKGLQMLVQNPNPDDPIVSNPICLEAAEYFKRCKSTGYVVRSFTHKTRLHKNLYKHKSYKKLNNLTYANLRQRNSSITSRFKSAKSNNS